MSSTELMRQKKKIFLLQSWAKRWLSRSRKKFNTTHQTEPTFCRLRFPTLGGLSKFGAETRKTIHHHHK